jgi:uncharacterized protein (DUF58 family)
LCPFIDALKGLDYPVCPQNYQRSSELRKSYPITSYATTRARRSLGKKRGTSSGGIHSHWSPSPPAYQKILSSVEIVTEPLFDETFIRRLERLTLVARRVRLGQGQGERRSTKRGSSVEFADYRAYTPGDDLRRLDWHVYARLERPFIKLFEEEEDQIVHLLLDSSGSMDWPEADTPLNKWNYGRRLLAALGYIALASGDRLAVSQVNRDGLQTWGPRRGRGHFHSLLSYLTKLAAGGVTDLDAGLRRFVANAKKQPGSGRRSGLLFLVSDLFSPAGYEQGLVALLGAGHEVNVLHLLAPDETTPIVSGDLRLVDVETGFTQEVSVDPVMQRLYRRRFESWRAEIEGFCFARDINYVTLETTMAFEAVILGYLKHKGFVR